MAYISDNFHKEKLKKYNINIKTNYIVNNDIFERNTDNSKNDKIVNGIRCQKIYYVNNVIKHIEKDFDSRMEYSFVDVDNSESNYVCPNCGIESKLKDFIDGCPYCKTYYNIDYKDKDLGTKYHYDRVLRNTKYRFVTAIVDIIISMILSFIYIKTTSRTFNNVDVIKVFVYGGILSMILYYIFYLLDAYIILGPIKKYKDKQNQKQIEFWNKTKYDKKSLFNNLNYEVRKYYYSKTDIIDYDVLDYIDFKDITKDNKKYVEVTAEVRIVKYINGKITSKTITEKYLMMKNDNGTLTLKDGVNIITCYNCGASIDAEKTECNYCHSEIKYLQEWILIK